MKMKDVLVLGGLALGAYFLLKQKTVAAKQIPITEVVPTAISAEIPINYPVIPVIVGGAQTGYVVPSGATGYKAAVINPSGSTTYVGTGTSTTVPAGWSFNPTGSFSIDISGH